MSALVILLLAAPAARATAALDGGTGFLEVPRADTVQWAQSQVSVAVSALHAWEGGLLAGIPFGMAWGMGARTELGIALRADGFDPAPTRETLDALGGHVRRRLRDPGPDRRGLAVEVVVRSLDQQPAGALRGIVEGAAGAVGWAAAAGPRWAAGAGPELWAGGGAEARLGRTSRLVADATLAAGLGGLTEASARAGVRFRLRERLQATTWSGGGWSAGRPWLGIGVAIDLYTVDPAEADRDSDGIADWEDRCRYAPEDADGWEDADGCPDPDNDGDGIPDEEDDTPNGEPPAEERGYPTPTPTLRMRIGGRAP